MATTTTYLGLTKPATNEAYDIAIFNDNADLIDEEFTKLSTPRFNDIVFELTPSRIGSNDKPDYDYTNVGLLFPQNNVNEIAYFTIQLPHSWKVGTTIYPHIHIQQAADQQATFRMEYKWYDIGDAIPASWSTYDLDTYAIEYTSGTISNIILGADGIDGAGQTISSILKIKLFRTDNVYTGDMLADQFDIHIEIDGFGSQEEYIKT
jgi:hypothetical protein